MNEVYKFKIVLWPIIASNEYLKMFHSGKITMLYSSKKISVSCSPIASLDDLNGLKKLDTLKFF